MASKDISRQEKIKLRQLEFKENNRKALCIVNLLSTIITVGLAIATLVILNTDQKSCAKSHLRLTLWLMLGMHVINTVEAVCGLTGFDKIFCGCICVVGFFMYEIAVLVYMNTVYFNSGHCEKETPTQYYWLLTNIIVYFGLLAVAAYFHIRGLFGSASEEEREREGKEEGQVLGMALNK